MTTRGRQWPATWLVLSLVWGLTGCDQEEPVERQMPSQDVMQGAPLYYPSQAVARSGTESAVETVYHARITPDSLAEWYRDQILIRGWEIVGDVPDGGGNVVLHVRRDGPPLWVIISPLASEDSSEFRLIGAAPDTTRDSIP